MRVRINGHGQINMRTAYDICGFLVIENSISNPFESLHNCLHRSNRHKRSSQLKYFKILKKCIVRGEIRTHTSWMQPKSKATTPRFVFV
jgi:hypothetical protein